MAWVQTYSATWADVEGLVWSVSFAEDGGSGPAVALTPGPTPAKLTWNGGDKYQPIVGSSLEIQLVYESAIDNLHTEQSQHIKVTLIRDSVVKWTGFLVPGQYYRQFNNPKHYVTLTATDGLGQLSEIKFEDDDGDPYFGIQTEIVVIANILLKTGLALSIYEYVNIFDANHTTGADYSPLNQTYIYQEAYWDEQTDERANCYQVLEDILIKYGASIRVSSAWVIVRPNMYSIGTTSYRTFTSAGVFSASGTDTPCLDVGPNLYYLHADQELRKLMGYGRCEVSQSPPRRENILKNGSFDAFTWTGTAFTYWSVSGTPNYDSSTNRLWMKANNAITTPDEYIYTTVNIYKAKSISLNFDYIATYAGTPTYKSIIFMIREDFTGKYLTSAGWDGSLNYYVFAPAATATDYSMSIDLPNIVTGGTFNQKTRLIISIYEFFNENTPASNYVYFDNMRIEVESYAPDTKLHVYENSVNITNINSVDIALGDSWCDEVAPGTSVDDEYFITMYDTSLHLTTDWQIKGDPTAAAPLAEVLARQMVEGFRRSIDELSGTLRSTYVPFGTFGIKDANIVDEYGYTKSFMPTNVTLDVRLNECNGTWVECPATYTDAALEWASHDCGGDATMTANSIEVNEWTSGGNGEFAYFDDYDAVVDETIRIKLTLTDDLDGGGGATTKPKLSFNSGTYDTAWGTNYYSFSELADGLQTIALICVDGVAYFNFTCVIDVYGITGV